MKINDLSDEQLSRWIAECLGWRFETSGSGSFWHHPDCLGPPNGHKECGRSTLDFVTDPAMTVMLMEKMSRPHVWRNNESGVSTWHCDPDVDSDGPWVEEVSKLGRAVAEAFALANGYPSPAITYSSDSGEITKNGVQE